MYGCTLYPVLTLLYAINLSQSWFGFQSVPVQEGFQFIKFFHSSQSKIGPSLLYPFILSIRTSPRWVPVNYILLFISSVLVQNWTHFIIFFHSFVTSQSKFCPSLWYPFILSSVPVQVWSLFIISIILSIRPSLRLDLVYHIHYPMNSSQSKISPNLLNPLSNQFVQVQGWP